MHQRFISLFFLYLVMVAGSCKKENKTNNCSPDIPTVRRIDNKPAVIKLTATVNPAYIVEQGSIDTKLIPCNLPMEFFENDLRVVISGEVKPSAQQGGTCCTENLFITKITR